MTSVAVCPNGSIHSAVTLTRSRPGLTQMLLCYTVHVGPRQWELYIPLAEILESVSLLSFSGIYAV
jgi:hypothetical protein